MYIIVYAMEINDQSHLEAIGVTDDKNSQTSW